MALVPRSSDRGPLAKKITSSCIVHPPAFLKSNKPARRSVDFGQVSFLERQWSLSRSWYARCHHGLFHASPPVAKVRNLPKTAIRALSHHRNSVGLPLPMRRLQTKKPNCMRLRFLQASGF